MHWLRLRVSPQPPCVQRSGLWKVTGSWVLYTPQWIRPAMINKMCFQVVDSGWDLKKGTPHPPWVLVSLSSSWQPWCEQLASSTPLHHTLAALESATCGLNLWSKINPPPSGCGCEVCGPRSEKVTTAYRLNWSYSHQQPGVLISSRSCQIKVLSKHSNSIHLTGKNVF